MERKSRFPIDTQLVNRQEWILPKQVVRRNRRNFFAQTLGRIATATITAIIAAKTPHLELLEV